MGPNSLMVVYVDFLGSAALPRVTGCLAASSEANRTAKLLNGSLHLEGQGDLVSRLILWIIGVITWCVAVINPLTKSP